MRRLRRRIRRFFAVFVTAIYIKGGAEAGEEKRNLRKIRDIPLTRAGDLCIMSVWFFVISRRRKVYIRYRLKTSEEGIKPA